MRLSVFPLRQSELDLLGLTEVSFDVSNETVCVSTEAV